MTVEDIIAGYYDETKESAECDAYADTLYKPHLLIPVKSSSDYLLHVKKEPPCSKKDSSPDQYSVFIIRI